ncbi:penicillin-binding protein 2 [Pseudomonas sp. A-1]|jgi:penicillin-binding protein 2|uniref:penicillin-binding protein 2 n=1 Tax=unclassified Pseudomonas TaxID=196821 RepID=UPI0010A5B195|nr:MULTISPECIES: penicillin-binding protein 2 [unclassified Pseudomonas]THG79425.1 penicillin-binding protein 2 [Pseudomonas sp. A-1]WPP43959.1 penicillin-binding protein 2 [Pseudomonas sp. AN-1]
MPQPIQLKDHERDARLVRSRAIVGAIFVLLLTGVLVARMYYLQVIQYEHHSTLAENNRIHVQPLPPTRGLIYDRNGVIIADNRPSFSLTVSRERADDWRQVLDTIVEVLELGEEERALFEKRVRQGRRPFEPVPILFELTEEQIARIAVNQFRLPGVDVVAQLVRHYPQGEHFAHSVGYVGRINEQELKRLDPVDYSGTHHIGKTGAEKFYENVLHGQVGYEEVETNARGRVLRVLKHTDPIPGKDIRLHLDLKLQEAAEAALGGRRGAVIAIEPATGGVLAMVSQPSFNPNLFVTGIGFKDYAALRDSIDRPLYNRVLRGLYPPGSTVKPQVALAGLDAGVVNSASRVYDPGYYQLPGNSHKYRNWNRSGDGWVDLNLALARSNDTYFYDLAIKLGIDRLHQYMSAFGLGQRVSLDLSEEAAGLMPSREWKRANRRQGWFPGETVITGIGQGYMLTTPLQLAQATALIANRGRWVRPRLLRDADGMSAEQLMASGLLEERDTPPNIVASNPRYWDQVTRGMVEVVHGARGTAHKLGLGSPYLIAGKSGTAQVVAIRQGEKYDRNKVRERHRDHALFVAFAPANDPKIAVAVMVENGESGSGVAGPVAKQVLDAWLLDEHRRLKPEFAPPPAAEVAREH